MSGRFGPARWTDAAWGGYLVVGGVTAVIAAVMWTEALVSGRPVLYGEGAVANAALILRDGNPYRDVTGQVAANYPPLYLLLASLGDPLRAGRAVTIASAVAVAAVLWWRARDAGPVPRAALAIGWLGLVPVAVWGAAVKPDLLAVALTIGGVVALERALSASARPSGSRVPAAAIGGALLAAAIWAKPTAILPAIAVLAYVLLVDRRAFPRATAGGVIVGALALAHAATLGLADIWRHVVVWNALPWSAEQAVLLLVLGAATIGLLVAGAALSGAFRGIAFAYVLGAFGVALLGGREGATINYLLDLAAATSFAVAAAAPRLAIASAFPLTAAAQLVIGFLLVAPFGLVPGRGPGTGAWGPAQRMEVIRSLPRDGKHLVEDSGLLIAAGLTPVVDDLFLWSRLVGNGAIGPALATGRVGSGEFTTVVSEFDLERYETASAAQRARWHPVLVREVLFRYELDRTLTRERDGAPILWVYRPR